MNDFLVVVAIGLLAAFLTYLGAPAAERYSVSANVTGGMLQFAAGIITALVAFTLMPPAVRDDLYLWIVLAFFIGGVLFAALEYFSERLLASRPDAAEGSQTTLALYVGIIADLVIDGVVIGIGSTLTLTAGLLLALGLAISTAPLTFVTTATAKRQGVAPRQRRLLGYLCFLAVFGGAMLGYLVLRNQSLQLRFILVALASGFLITMVIQGMIPEANKEGESRLASVLYIGGVSLYAMMSLVLQ